MALTFRDRGDLTLKYSSLERRVWRLWNSWGFLGILTVVGLIIAGSFGWIDAEKYAPYVFGIYGVVAGGLLTAYSQVFDQMLEKRFGPEWPSAVPTRFFGLVFLFGGAMMVVIQVLGYQ